MRIADLVHGTPLPLPRGHQMPTPSTLPMPANPGPLPITQLGNAGSGGLGNLDMRKLMAMSVLSNIGSQLVNAGGGRASGGGLNIGALLQMQQQQQALAQQQAQRNAAVSGVRSHFAQPSGQTRAEPQSVVGPMGPRRPTREVPMSRAEASPGLYQLAQVYPERFAQNLLDNQFKQQSGFSLSPGQARFDAQGNVIASVPASPSTSGSWVLDTRNGKPAYVSPVDLFNDQSGPKHYAKLPSGMRVRQTADGFEVVTGDFAREGDAVAATNTTKTNLQKELLRSQDRLQRLGAIQAGFKPEWLQTPTQIQNWTLAARERMGIDLNPQQQAQLAAYTDFQGSTVENLSFTLNELSGAAVSDQEYRRIEGFMPNMNMSPTQFQTTLNRMVGQLRIAGARYHYALKNGITDVEEISRLFALTPDSMNSFMKQRARELKDNVPSGLDDAAQERWITEQLETEFGL